MSLVVLTQPGCGPCIGVKAYLKKNGIPFDEVNVRESLASAQLVKDLGYPGTPVTIGYDGSEMIGSVHGFDQDTIAHLAQKAS